MTNSELLGEEPICEFELRAELDKIKKKVEELNFRANRTLEYLNAVSKINHKNGAELKKKLHELNIPRIKEEVITKIIDLLPSTEDELKMILSSYSLTISKENIKKILSTVSQFIK